MKKSVLLALFSAVAIFASAQNDLLAEKNIFTLGPAKTWSNGDASYTFITEDLSKLVAVPTNTSNVFLYPENGAINNAENQAIGAQGFYIDMGSVQTVSIVNTTWEGAAADNFSIYLSDEVPTLDILETTPTYSVEGLGQYTANTAVLPEGSSGRYLTFQVTKATNWGWGVKIRSIAAFSPYVEELATFSVSPTIVMLDTPTPLTLTLLDQFGMDIDPADVTISTSDNAEYAEGAVTVKSGTQATVTATLADTSIDADIYVAVAPEIPDATSIKTPIFTNGITSDNATAGWLLAYNGGAVNAGMLEFSDGTVAQAFSETRCVFFYNSVTTGAWDGHINPSESGYRSLCLDIFGTKEVQGYVDFEGVTGIDLNSKQYFNLAPGEWTHVEIIIMGATQLNNMSVRFTADNICDIMLANIYFTAAYVEGDENAPVLSEITATPAMTSVDLSFSATDEENDNIYYTITLGDAAYNYNGISGETVEYTIEGLEPNTQYTVSVVAGDGLNTSESQEVTFTTLSMPNSPEPALSADDMVVIYSSFSSESLPEFDSWGSAGKLEDLITENGNGVLGFYNYMEQWGGLVNLTVDTDQCRKLHVDVFTDDVEGSFDLAPVWADANGATTPGTSVTVKLGEWTSYDFDLSTFGYPSYGTSIVQVALTNSTLSSFSVDNIYLFDRAPKQDEDSVQDAFVSADDFVDVVNMQGIVVRRGVRLDSALDGLPSGVYIVAGKKLKK